MPFLIRRISRAKWPALESEGKKGIKAMLSDLKILLKGVDISADAVTGCLKTTKNTLSVWYIKDESELEQAVLALITGSKQTSLSTLHVAVIDEKLVLKKGLEIVESRGDTVIAELAKSHKDLSDLTYNRLGDVRNLILNCIKENKIVLYTRSELKRIITKALADGRLNKTDLNKELVLVERL